MAASAVVACAAAAPQWTAPPEAAARYGRVAVQSDAGNGQASSLAGLWEYQRGAAPRSVAARFESSVKPETAASASGSGSASGGASSGADESGRVAAPAGFFLPVPGEVLLPVEGIAQRPQLPNGCEITSLTIVMNYHGLPADKLELADSFLPKAGGWWGVDPGKEYMGNPRGSGWYCYQGPIQAAARAYLEHLGAEGCALALAVSGQNDLEEMLRQGKPVITWVTIGFRTPYRSSSHGWELNGEWYQPYTNLHCLVVTGFDADYFYLADPLENFERIEKDVFMDIFTQMGSRALVLYSEPVNASHYSPEETEVEAPGNEAENTNPEASHT